MSIDDKWSQAEETILEDSIARAILSKERKLPYTGSCYGCGEDIPEPQIFCSNTEGQSCQELYEFRKNQHRQNRLVK